MHTKEFYNCTENDFNLEMDKEIDLSVFIFNFQLNHRNFMPKSQLSIQNI